MCFNCGCQMPDNKMGKDENITTKEFAAAATAMGQTTEEAMLETYKLIKKVLKLDDEGKPAAA